MDENKSTNIKYVVAGIVAVVLVITLVMIMGGSKAQAPLVPEGSKPGIAPPIPPAQQASEAAAKPQLSIIDVPAPTNKYTAAKDGFSVNFPTAPTVTNSTFKSPTGGTLPVTTYEQKFTKGSRQAFYEVSVYHYPPTYQFATDYLTSAFKLYGSVAAMRYPGAAIASQQPSTFLGGSAVTGLITVPVKETATSTVTVSTGNTVVVTIKGQNLYIISAYGMSADNYNTFLNSFAFAQ